MSVPAQGAALLRGAGACDSTFVRVWLRAASPVALVALVGCGSGPGGTFIDGGGPGKDGSLDGGGDRTVGDSSGGPDSSGDGTVHDTGKGDGSGVSDALLDIKFPDGLGPPDMSSDTGETDTAVDTGCAPDSITCSGSTAVTCKKGIETMTACSGKKSTCAPGYGCVVCVPGSGSCSGSTGTICASDGSGYVTNNCDPLEGLTCLGGVCTGDCADIGQSYIGCEYYAVTMANSLLDQGNFTFVVSIANTSSSPADINIQGGALSSAVTATIPSGGIQDFTLPWVSSLSCGPAPCDANDVEVPELEGLNVYTSPPPTSIVSAGAYHIRSTEPVTAYQFNARDYAVTPTSEVYSLMYVGAYPTEYSYTNDASLLLPVNAMTGNYYLVGYYDWYWPAFLTVVGTQNGTSVTLAANTTILTGSVAGLGSTGGTVTLNAGDVLQVLTPGTGTVSYGGNLSGSTITATAPVEVFGGHDCTNIPGSTSACDHLEQINFPLETLGTDYLVAVPYNKNELSAAAHGRQYVQIVGTAAGTTLTYDGISGEPTSVGAGGVVTFEATTNFRVTATNPIEIGQYMEGQQAFDSNCKNNLVNNCGDPSLSLAVATAQFRTSYPFTAPQNYLENWVNVIFPAGSTVTITDTPSTHTIKDTDPGASQIGSASGYYVEAVPLCANNLSGCNGNHTATGTMAFGIEVYGYGSYTSYMYPGGLNLTR